MKKAVWAQVLGVLLLAMPAFATTYSIQCGGISGLSYDISTGGGAGDSWKINEIMTGTGTLQLGERPLGGGNSTGSIHSFGKWFIKTVTNNSAEAWTSFELELQSVLGEHSLDGDGLSFGQGGGFAFFCDRFSTYTAIEDIRDYLNFSGGTVNPGDSVAFTFVITDTETDDPF